MSDLSPENQAICSNASNSICTACSSRNNCNTDTVRRNEQCLVCSSALEPKCSQQPSEVAAEHCGVPSGGQCFTRIQAGATIRGCMGSLSSGQCMNQTESVLLPTSLCTVDSGPGTNNKIVPIGRLKCYHCDSRIDDSCHDGPTSSTPTLPCISYLRPEMCLKLDLNDGSGEFSSERRKFNLLVKFSSQQLFEVVNQISVLIFVSSVAASSAITKKDATKLRFKASTSAWLLYRS